MSEPRSYSRWTQETDALLRRYWADPTVTGPEIAALTGHSIGSVEHRAVDVLKLGRKATTAFDWSDANVERLKAHWGKGLSAAQIGRELGITRNAAIGKLNRLGLKWNRPAPAGRKATPGAKPAIRPQDKVFGATKVPPVSACHSQPKPRKAPVQFIICGDGAVLEKPPSQAPKAEIKADAWAPLPGSEPITLIGLHSTSCKWPVELQGVTEHHFCGNFAIGRYCAEHVRAEARRSAAQHPKAAKNLQSLIRVARRAA